MTDVTINYSKLQDFGVLAAEYAHQRVDLESFWWFRHFEQKFAEQIITKCADILMAEAARLDTIPGREVSAQSFETARLLILNHFGVTTHTSSNTTSNELPQPS